ncbi:hypothetical protein [Streptomyces aureocirculatus]|uniref:hypothetical protein n=1 Tax=Streptomyces aureocirculatus TaxID=67275 RepID=UPI00099E1613|nr:hypothetical protein [Streptomyces aureocirculatus]
MYPSSIDLPRHTSRLLARQLISARQEIGTRRWRPSSAARKALLTLAHLRRSNASAQLAAGFGIEIATTYRHID